MDGNSKEGKPVIKVIKTDADYKAALAQIEHLVELDPEVGTEEADQLELLALLIEQYETQVFPIRLPSAIAAIKFRMEQEHLEPKDLLPYIGSRSKVSEVLSGKRPLSVSMMRKLHSGLGIPAEVLLQGESVLQLEEEQEPIDEDIEWERFPVHEMVRRGWLSAEALMEPVRALRAFFAPLGGPKQIVALYRKTLHTRSNQQIDKYALFAWRARVMIRALQATPPVKFEEGSITQEFLRTVAELSVLDNGPAVAREFLFKRGILLIIEPQLPHTYLDGAAMKTSEGYPVIGLTIRYDRLDNFWFTLIHELKHLASHLTDEDEFYDNLDASSEDIREQEADETARETLVPSSAWARSGARATGAPANVKRLAETLHVHVSVVAGRVRYDKNNYTLLNDLVGHNEVRRCFPAVTWN